MPATDPTASRSGPKLQREPGWAAKIVKFRRVNGGDGNHGIGIDPASNHSDMRDITELGIAISSSTTTPPGIISALRRCWFDAGGIRIF